MTYSNELIEIAEKIKPELEKYNLDIDERWAWDTDRENLVDSYIHLKKKLKEYEKPTLKDILNDTIENMANQDYGDTPDTIFESSEEKQEWEDSDDEELLKKILQRVLDNKRLKVLK